MKRFGRTVGALLAASALLVSAAPAGAAAPRPATGWSVQRTPFPLQVGLAGVSCASAHRCVAVGQYERPVGGAVAVAEVWDGRTWRISPTPALRSNGFVELTDVSCPSATWCLATGYASTATGTATLVERWDGRSWARVPAPRSAVDGVSGLACASPTFCMAVQTVDSNSAGRPAGERWDGRAWRRTFLPSPRIKHLFALSVDAVSCPTSADCVAVGAAVSIGRRIVLDDLAWHWDGTGWAPQIVARRTFTGAGFFLDSSTGLGSVSCATQGRCLAVGTTLGGGTDAEQLRGSQWTAVPVTGRSGHGPLQLQALSCSTPASCTAVGYAATPQGTRLLAAAWDGTRLAFEAPARPSFPKQSVLTAVSCAPGGGCTAVGNTGREALVERQR